MVKAVKAVAYASVALAVVFLVGCDGAGPTAPPGGEHTVAADQGPPCENPVRWRLGQIDAAFGLSGSQYLNAVEEAISVWESAAGFRMFEYAPEDGMPINLVYGNRQIETLEMQALQGEMEKLALAIKQEHDALREAKELLESAREEHARRVNELNARIEELNSEVGSWNRRGGPPDGEHARLQDTTRSLRAEGAAVESSSIELRRLSAEIEAATQAQNARIELYNRLVQTFNERYTGRRIQSAIYEEVSAGRSRARRINVFQYDDPQHLVLVLAHELGHALGIDHVRDPLAIMYEEYMRENYEYPVRLREADLRELRALCATCPH